MRLTAYLDGTRVGWFEQISGGQITLEYDRAWQNLRTRVELSLSMPKSRRTHTGAAPGNYLWNLLPDDDDVLERWGRAFGVSSRNPMALLAHVGLDAAGAIQLIVSEEYDEPTLTSAGEVAPLSEAQIAAHLRELRDDPSAWVSLEDSGGYFSLAGAQPKFTLARTKSGWGAPSGRGASTHIVKAGIRGLKRSDLNEHLTMRAAHFMGLRVASNQILSFEDQTAIVVTRFDRVPGENGSVVRLHQEDFAQATGVHPSQKYHSDGGPGITDIGTLLGESFSRIDEESVMRFFDATLFNWAVLGTDAHAKNYAILNGPLAGSRRATVAPLYDLGSALAYADINNRKSKLAMSFKGRYRPSEIEPRHLTHEGANLGIAEELVIDRAQHMASTMTEAFSQAVAEAGLTDGDAEFGATLVDRASERATTLIRQLDRP